MELWEVIHNSCRVEGLCMNAIKGSVPIFLEAVLTTTRIRYSLEKYIRNRMWKFLHNLCVYIIYLMKTPHWFLRYSTPHLPPTHPFHLGAWVWGCDHGKPWSINVQQQESNQTGGSCSGEVEGGGWQVGVEYLGNQSGVFIRYIM